eukprot:CAMPEP_0119478852 /NCGR_PEP_ID=MMETSP1344-20130328/8398_1 /TAXON_ID=236787 /ORGANISM="Florenciella parvula, Strain CCMP2471" /LENGTH=152 /DNA_ID=CAMNT_0007513055 /DNA_START=1890 /DNA_END=2348 /DNA_ORIENTATION=-
MPAKLDEQGKREESSIGSGMRTTCWRAHNGGGGVSGTCARHHPFVETEMREKNQQHGLASLKKQLCAFTVVPIVAFVGAASAPGTISSLTVVITSSCRATSAKAMGTATAATTTIINFGGELVVGINSTQSFARAFVRRYRRVRVCEHSWYA